MVGDAGVVLYGTFSPIQGSDIDVEQLVGSSKARHRVQPAHRPRAREDTVKTCIRSLYARIGVTTRTQAALWGVDHGFRPWPVRRIDPTTL
ncbi:hypothetical protein BHE97_11640 [Aeromicrobium sp. PE09-221]|nr:hypothetical protein BHE97_11640 [Aeromicrobium sp. PE09-221]